MTGYTIIVFSISSNLITPRMSSKNCIFEPESDLDNWWTYFHGIWGKLPFASDLDKKCTGSKKK